jgi:hypothetical protein
MRRRQQWPAGRLCAEIVSLPLATAQQPMAEQGLQLGFPIEFDSWLLRCLDREPKRRFASAGESISVLCSIFGAANQR